MATWKSFAAQEECVWRMFKKRWGNVEQKTATKMSCGCSGSFKKAEIFRPHTHSYAHVICHTFHSRQWVSSRRHQVFIRPRMLNFWWVFSGQPSNPSSEIMSSYENFIYMPQLYEACKIWSDEGNFNRKLYGSKWKSFGNKFKEFNKYDFRYSKRL